MQGFTLIETAIVILLMTLLFGVIFNFNIFNKDLFYLRDEAKNLVFALDTTADLSQKILQNKENEYYCGYGIYFPNNNSYLVLAFSTTTNLCEDIGTGTSLSNFINDNINTRNFIHKNQEIRKDIIESLSLNRQLKQPAEFIFSDNPNCENNINPPLSLLYIYGYNELFFSAQKQKESWEKLNLNEIYICLKKGNELLKIKINKLGQASLIQ